MKIESSRRNNPLLKPAQAIGIDLGGTKIATALMDDTGTVLHRRRESTDVSGGPEAVIRQMVQTVQALRSAPEAAPVALGVGVAGQIDPATGAVIFAPNLNWRNVSLRDALEQELGLPVSVTNDVRAATWGEWIYGAGRDCDNLVCIFIGTGVGGGIVLDGKMLTGCTNTAGEVGHMIVSLNGPPCTCGKQGCMEALAGGWAVALRAREAARSDPEAGNALLLAANGLYNGVTARIVAQVARTGDPLAGRIIEDAVEALAAGAATLINVFNPRRLILGGGVLEGMPELLPRIALGVASRALDTPFAGCSIVPARLRADAGTVGAATFALRETKAKGWG